MRNNLVWNNLVICILLSDGLQGIKQTNNQANQLKHKYYRQTNKK